MKDMAKTVPQGLVCESFELPGASIKETRGLNIINHRLQGLAHKKTDGGLKRTAGSILEKFRG